MAQYWAFQFSNPSTGSTMRSVVYAPDAGAASSRLRQWLASNPFQLGSTDLKDFLSTWDNSSHGASPSSTPPARQGGDIYLAFPSGAPSTDPPPDGTGGTKPPFIGPPEALPEDEINARFLQGLFQRGVDTKSIAGRAQAKQKEPYLTTFQFRQGLQGMQPNPSEGGEFERFVRDRNIRDVRGEASAALDALLKSGGTGGTAGELHQQFDNPETAQADKLATLAYQALAGRVDPLALKLLRLPEGSELRDRFLAERGGAQGGFLDYFRQNFPLLAGFGQ